MAETNSRAADIPKMRIVPGRPALYKTIMKVYIPRQSLCHFAK